MDTAKLLSGIEQAAREAGRIMLEAEDIEHAVHDKEGHANFVTDYDRRVQEYLFDKLAQLLPQARFIGEEEGADAFTEEDRRGFAFCVDPIDGTTNFIKGYRPSVTSIGLLLDDKPYMGVVYNPYDDMLFSAVRGGGARLNGKPIASSGEPLAKSLIMFGTAPYNPEKAEETFALCAQYLRRGADLRRSGTAAWDLCSVAMGTTGLFFEMRLGLWDFAAAALIAEEAGCVLTDLSGRPLRYDGPSSVLCASRGVAKENYLPE